MVPLIDWDFWLDPFNPVVWVLGCLVFLVIAGPPMLVLTFRERRRERALAAHLPDFRRELRAYRRGRSDGGSGRPTQDALVVGWLLGGSEPQLALWTGLRPERVHALIEDAVLRDGALKRRNRPRS